MSKLVTVSLKFISSSEASVCRGSGKGKFLFSVIPGFSKESKKFGNISLESCSQIWEKTRTIHFLVQFSGK